MHNVSQTYLVIGTFLEARYLYHLGKLIYEETAVVDSRELFLTVPCRF